MKFNLKDIFFFNQLITLKNQYLSVLVCFSGSDLSHDWR